MMSSSHPKWSELPKELVEIIGKHLDCRIDVFRFRAVSCLWRSMVSPSYRLSQPIPLILPPPINAPATLTHFTICRLEHCKSPTSACLVKVLHSAKLQLAHPLKSQFLGTTHFQISLHHSGPAIQRSINMLDFRLLQLTKGISLDFQGRTFNDDVKIKKALLFASHGHGHGHGVLVLLDSGKLWYSVFGGPNWVHLGSEGTHFDDLIMSNNKYYALDYLGVIYWIDDRTMNFVQYSPPLCGFGQVKTLVESEGEFYVVDSYLEEDQLAGAFNLVNNQCRFRWVDIKVYKLDEEWGTWVDVKSLGNHRVFVLGKELSYCVNVKDFPGCPGDCIYFVDPRLEDRNVTDELKRLVIRVFRFDNGSIRTMDCFPAYRRLFTPARTWSMPIPSSP